MTEEKKLLLIELNELNFEFVRLYLESGENLPNFAKLIGDGVITTHAEAEYDLLEPWIQWASVHTGKTYKEHSVYRLGDITECNQQQIFEKLEARGYKVGVFGAMNAENRLASPAYFVPDPWTQTTSDDSVESRFLTAALRQTVNDNSRGKVAISSALKLSYVCFKNLSLFELFNFSLAALKSFHKPWRRAIFLDRLLAKLHSNFFLKKRPDFSVLFLNAGAHIQHHYMLNSVACTGSPVRNPAWYCDASVDPVLECYKAYDEILGEVIATPGTEFLIATGLSQRPYSRPIFYYRPSRHEEFFGSFLNMRFSVFPRMTRDSLLTFDSREEAIKAAETLRSVKIGETELFGEIDVRGTELFVVLTYDREIKGEDIAHWSSGSMKIFDQVVFVALKNGEHSSNGSLVCSPCLRPLAYELDGNHVSGINKIIDEYFTSYTNMACRDISK